MRGPSRSVAGSSEEGEKEEGEGGERKLKEWAEEEKGEVGEAIAIGTTDPSDSTGYTFEPYEEGCLVKRPGVERECKETKETISSDSLVLICLDEVCCCD